MHAAEIAEAQHQEDIKVVLHLVPYFPNPSIYPLFRADLGPGAK